MREENLLLIDHNQKKVESLDQLIDTQDIGQILNVVQEVTTSNMAGESLAQIQRVSSCENKDEDVCMDNLQA